MDLSKLKEPFPGEDIEWRVGRAGEKNGKPWAMVLAYVTARAIQDRLDDVCGPGCWRNEFRPGVDGGVLCGISIKVGDEWVTKWDGAENTNIDPVKGGLSGATKRAAVQWGIGRYLYNLTEGWANIHEAGSMRGEAKKNDGSKLYFKWNPPKLPAWALPKPKSSIDAGFDAVKAAALGKGIADDSLEQYCQAEFSKSLVDLPVEQLRDLHRAITSGIVTTYLNSQVPS
jgi:hypothetical protein